MKYLKKIFPILLCAVLFAAILPTGAAAAS